MKYDHAVYIILAVAGFCLFVPAYMLLLTSRLSVPVGLALASAAVCLVFAVGCYVDSH